jgi:hypothetical protein
MYYFTGKPCSYGHVERRLVSTGGCRGCTTELNYIANAQRRERRVVPEWIDVMELKRFYRERPVGQTVDHIVPLKGITVEGWPVSGLHVPWNLQYLPLAENVRKKNVMREQDEITAPIS